MQLLDRQAEPSVVNNLAYMTSCYEGPLLLRGPEITRPHANEHLAAFHMMSRFLLSLQADAMPVFDLTPFVRINSWTKRGQVGLGLWLWLQ